MVDIILQAGSEGKRHEDEPISQVVRQFVVWGDDIEAKTRVQRFGLGLTDARIQTHGQVASQTSVLDDPLGYSQANSLTLKARVYEHALHLAVSGIYGSQSYATNRLAFKCGEQQPAWWWRIDTWKRGQFLLELRSVEVRVDEVQVLGVTLSVPRHEGTHKVTNCVKLAK